MPGTNKVRETRDISTRDTAVRRPDVPPPVSCPLAMSHDNAPTAPILTMVGFVICSVSVLGIVTPLKRQTHSVAELGREFGQAGSWYLGKPRIWEIGGREIGGWEVGGHAQTSFWVDRVY